MHRPRTCSAKYLKHRNRSWLRSPLALAGEYHRCVRSRGLGSCCRLGVPCSLACLGGLVRSACRMEVREGVHAGEGAW